MQYEINQIVRGINRGVFVIIGIRQVGGEYGYQVKEVNPNNLTQHAPGEMFFTEDMLTAYN